MANNNLEQQLTEQFNAQLHRLFQQLASPPEAEVQSKWLLQLAETEIIRHWDIESTLLGMVGRTQWQALSREQQQALSESFKLTLIRYFMEAYQYYDGQKVRLEGVQLNAAQNKGWLKLVIDLDYVPDLTVDLSLIRRGDQWLFRDLRFQGIAYTRLKRGYYQSRLKQQGVQQLISELDAKNLSFFEQLGLKEVI
jgi:ABC-type transporter MlaC component